MREITDYNNQRADRVANGIEWLNENGPAEWWNMIDLEILNISNPDCCVLGQIYADRADEAGLISGYHYATWEWPEQDPIVSSDDIIELGFCGSAEEFYSQAREIELEWQCQIEDLMAEVYA